MAFSGLINRAVWGLPFTIWFDLFWADSTCRPSSPVARSYQTVKDFPLKRFTFRVPPGLRLLRYRHRGKPHLP